MKLRAAAAVAVIGCMVAATTVLADNGRGNQRGNGHGDNRDDARSGRVDATGDGDSGRGNDAVHRPRGTERRVASRSQHQAPVQPQCGTQPAPPAHCQPQPVPRVQCPTRPVPQAQCASRPEPRRDGEQCRQQRERRPCRGQRERVHCGGATAVPAGTGGTATVPTDNGGRVHDDNGHGNDAGHTDPSNPGIGGGNHGTKQH